MTSEQRLRELEEKYEGYKVYDNQGEKIGKVDDLFVDESDNEEYIGVKLGLFGMKSTLIPMDIVRVNEADKAVEVSDTKDHVKDAPTFGDDDEVTPDYEDRVRSHFGLEAVGTSSSRGGYGAYSGAETSSGTDYASDESTAGSSATSTEYRGDEDSPEYTSTTGQDARSDDSSSVDTEYAERTDSATTSSASSDGDYDERSESSSGASTDTASSTTEGLAGGESTSDQESSGSPASRRTEETETVEEGGRTKVRRRVVREEIVEEDPGT